MVGAGAAARGLRLGPELPLRSGLRLSGAAARACIRSRAPVGFSDVWCLSELALRGVSKNGGRGLSCVGALVFGRGHRRTRELLVRVCETAERCALTTCVVFDTAHPRKNITRTC